MLKHYSSIERIILIVTASILLALITAQLFFLLIAL